MDRQQAQDIIKTTFESPFEKDRFAGFVKNLLNRIEDAPFAYHGNLIVDTYKPYISKYERIGKYHDGENRIDILIVHLNREKSIERARTMQRNFVAGYLQGKYGSSNDKEAAIAAFVSTGESDWRFSLVKMDYRFEEGKNGKVKVKEEFTPARRWSFLVGSNEASHTAQSRLVPILADDKNNPTLAQLEDAFNIETVSKEFFLKYRELFIRTKEALDKVVAQSSRLRNDFEAKGVDTVNFAKKLLGQIVFLYFLQKKGWFGVERDADWGTGSKHFLRQLFSGKHGQYANFFNDILEPLFYEALRRPRDDEYYSRFNCKIPFLNGGLFDPIHDYDWVHTDIIIPNELFSNNVKTKEGDTGNGILDVFDRYNFTVKEDEPLEKDVAIDPELLGKAYEKFNAIRPDNFEEYKAALKSGQKGAENKFNKKFGVYYTPREIVHYMCQQSLINYLYTVTQANVTQTSSLRQPEPNSHRQDAYLTLKDIETLIKFGDQVGENEAAVQAKGRETRDYSYKLPESIRQNAELIDRALADITVCDPAIGSGAFPVGMMHEIVKTRNLLRLIQTSNAPQASNVTLASQPEKPEQHRQDACDTYQFKRECIEKSLYGVDIDPGAVEIAKLRLWLSLVVDEEDIRQIKPLPNLDYKIVCGNSLLGVEKDLFNNQLFAELERLKPLHFDETNPTKKQEYKRQIDELISQITNGHSEFDFEVYFSEVFHEKGGFDVVLGNPPYVRADSGSKYLAFRRSIEKSGKYETLWEKWDLYVPFIERGYKLLKTDGLTTMIVSDAYCHAKYAQKSQVWFLENSKILRLDFLNRLELFEAGVRNITYLYQKANGKNNIPERRVHYPEFNIIINLSSEVQSNLTHRAFFPEDTKSQTYTKPVLPLGEICYISVGMVVHADEKVAKGAFRLEDLLSNIIDKKHPKPFVEGKDLNKWILDKPKYLEWGTSRAPSLFRRKTFIELYEQDEKLMLPMVGEIRAGIDTDRLYCNHGIFVGILWHKLKGVRNNSLKKSAKYSYEKSSNPNLPSREKFEKNSQHFSVLYLLGVLNSSAVLSFLKANRRNNIQMYPDDWKAVPIPDISQDQQEPIVTLVDRILATKNADPGTDTTALEREIDQMVYQLYGLTEEEIRIVEEEK